MMLNWNELEAQCLSCQKCALADKRTNVVFGVGPRDAEVMFIGEGPGENEDLQGEPFVGRGGKLLDDMLELIDLDRHKNVYIANIVKCRPPQNRDPLNTEQDACIGYLRNQAALIRPKIIVCLGRIAAMRIIKEDFKITKEHGQWFEKSGVQMMALFHPAAILRDPGKRPETFDDLKSLQAKIRQVCSRTYESTEMSLRGGQHPQGVRRIRKAAKLPTAAQRRENPNPRPAASLVKGRWHGEAVTEGFRLPESYPKNGIPQSASLTAPFNKGAKGRGLRIATSGFALLAMTKNALAPF